MHLLSAGPLLSTLVALSAAAAPLVGTVNAMSGPAGATNGLRCRRDVAAATRLVARWAKAAAEAEAEAVPAVPAAPAPAQYWKNTLGNGPNGGGAASKSECV